MLIVASSPSRSAASSPLRMSARLEPLFHDFARFEFHGLKVAGCPAGFEARSLEFSGHINGRLVIALATGRRPSNLLSARYRMCDHQRLPPVGGVGPIQQAPEPGHSQPAPFHHFFPLLLFVFLANRLHLSRVALGMVGEVRQEAAAGSADLAREMYALALECGFGKLFEQFVVIRSKAPETLQGLLRLPPRIAQIAGPRILVERL